MGRDEKKMPKLPAGARRQWAADRALRPSMRSPGRPEPSRAVQRDFWRRIASGVTTAEARWLLAFQAGRIPVVPSRWRHAADQPG